MKTEIKTALNKKTAFSFVGVAKASTAASTLNPTTTSGSNTTLTFGCLKK